MEVKQINVSAIKPHPQNPRKKLGDLTELTDSIRAMGVMQNLTVVPNTESKEYEYTVIIGHRRLAAAIEAGLETVPCQVVEMDEAKQVETMLMENMQRSDLTPIEEAEGFQMMLDFGHSVSDIKEMTGLSESKIRHRIKINDLDKDILKEKYEAEQIKMSDLIKLEEIEDVEKRNSVLKKIGTNNFDWELSRAVEEQNKEKGREKIMELMPNLIMLEDTEISFYDTSEVALVNDVESAIESAEKLNDSEDQLYIYKGWNGYSIRAYIPKAAEEDSEEKKAKRAQKEKDEQDREKVLEIASTSFENIMRFIEKEKVSITPQLETFIHDVIWKSGREGNAEEFGLVTSWQENYQECKDAALDKYGFEKMLIVAALTSLSYNSINNRFDKPGYEENNDMKKLYALVEPLGYKVSDDERALAEGTHYLFQR